MSRSSNDPGVLGPASRFDAPRFRSHSSSPTRSPTRRQHLTSGELDPLLSNLSPTSTLEALTATDAIQSQGGKQHDLLRDSIAQASTSERGLGIRAALAGKKLREWCYEVEGWEWPIRGFEEPSAEERASKKRKYGHEMVSHVVVGNKEQPHSEANDDEEYWGSMPAALVQRYENRIENIRDDMETLEVEELKEHVRGAHAAWMNSDVSSGFPLDAGRRVSQDHYLDDFTVIITATIMQALPLISRLDSMLNAWSVRFMVLRQVPGFLFRVKQATNLLSSAWKAIEDTHKSGADGNLILGKSPLPAFRENLANQICVVGRRCDAMLNALEGRKDIVPETWIDDVEKLETEFGDWVVEAEKRQFEEDTWAREVSLAGRRIPQDVSRTPSEDVSSRPRLPQLPASVSSAPSTRSFSISSTRGDQYPSASWVLADAPHSVGMGQAALANGHSLAPVDPDIVLSNRAQDEGANVPEMDIPNYEDTAEDDMSLVDGSAPGSPFSGGLSNMSSPEILDASKVEYFSSPTKEKSPIFPDTGHASPSENDLHRLGQMNERGLGSQLTRASTELASASSCRPRITNADNSVDRAESAPHTRSFVLRNEDSISESQVKRASITSISSLSRNNVRNITVTRSGSYSSTSSKVNGQHASVSSTTSPYRTDSPRIAEPGAALSNLNLDDSSAQLLPNSLDESGVIHRSLSNSMTPTSRPAILDRALGREQDTASLSLKRGSEPEGEVSNHASHQQTADLPRTMKSSADLNTDDELKARISSILTHIPARIKLSSQPEPFTTEHSRSQASSISTPNTRPAGSPRSDITLVPATLFVPKARSSNGDPEVKLYHLYQPGKDTPIKLFVRIVGEGGERVMVRVGGGWADLGEYLKDYAQHHGSRSVSDGKFDIRGMPQQSQTNSPVTATPNSQNSRRSRPGSPIVRPSATVSSRKTRSSFGGGASLDSSAPSTPETSFGEFRESTSGLTGSFRSPSTDDTKSSLGGPKKKRTDLSPGKQAWVDGMLNQARKVSLTGLDKKRTTNTNNEANVNVADLGRVGGTKRVFMKN